MASDEEIRRVVYGWTGIRIATGAIEKRIGLALISQELTPHALNPYAPQEATGENLEGSVRP